MPLRDYQQRAIEASWEWFMTEPGNPIIWLPTAGGKSWIAAELARKVVQETGGRVLVVAPSQELIAQNEEKMQMLWPEADCGMVCSGLKRKEFGHAITFGTLGSLVNHVHKLGEISLVIYDECHSVSINDKGDARKLLKYVKMMSGDGMRIVGLTASPYRGNGVWLTDSDDPIFSGICIRITVKELLDLGYLSPLVNPVMPTLINTTGVKETAGDFNLKELNEVTDREEINRNVVEQTIIHGANRNAWICFCVTVEHAEHICEEFRRQGIAAQTVHAGVDPSVRARRIYDFRSGKLKCLVTVLALLTGFDVPKVDLIVWLRSTKSQVLYCLDDQTEILTTEGWKSIGQIKIGERALSFDENTLEGEWSDIIGVVERDMDPEEKWVEYNSPYHNFRVTNNHAMIAKPRKGNKWNRMTAEKMAAHRDSVKVPTALHMEMPGVPLNDDELYLIGIIMTDGSISDKKVFIYQSEKYPIVIEKIESTLDRLNIRYTKYKNNAYSQYNSNYQRWVYLISVGEPRKKVDYDKRGIGYLISWIKKDFSDALLNCTKEQFLKIYEGMFDGDGTKLDCVTDYTPRTKQICTSRKNVADKLQTLATMHGMNSYIAKHQEAGRKNPIYRVSIKDKDNKSIGGYPKTRPQVEIKPFTNEKVWCVETKKGNIVTRRKGHVTLMGNCQGMGRGCRISPETGKKDCIVLDFSDTVERMGPVDLLTGRPARKSARKGAPFRVCPECGLQNPIAAPECRGCGHRFPEIERIKHGDQASTAQVLSKSGGLEHYSVDMINYSIHSKQGNPPSLRVDYFSDGKRVTSEYLPFGRLEEGWAHKKCMRWWNDMMPRKPFPDSIQAAVSIAAHALGTPEKIMCVRNASNPKYLDIVKRVFGENAHDENKSYSTVSMESW